MKKEELKRSLQMLVSTNNTLTGTVTATTNETCSVKVGAIIYEDVRLTAVNNGNEKTLITPKINSDVIITFVNASRTDAVVIAYSEIEKVVQIAEKFTIKNTQVSLKDLFKELITELKAAIITTPAGAGAISPTTIAKLETINTKVNQLFEE